jgi:hypothetical protein
MPTAANGRTALPRKSRIEFPAIWAKTKCAGSGRLRAMDDLAVKGTARDVQLMVIYLEQIEFF